VKKTEFRKLKRDGDRKQNKNAVKKIVKLKNIFAIIDIFAKFILETAKLPHPGEFFRRLELQISGKRRSFL
jgi:hypothetical protein